MSSIYVTVLCDANDELSLHAEWPKSDHPNAEARARLPESDFFTDLLEQGRSSGGHVHRLLGQNLGSILFSGDVGTLLREGLASGELSCIFLQTDAQRAEWPWELALDPETGARPAIDAGLVRLHGAQAGGDPVPGKGVLIVPRTGGKAKLKALQAATRTMARRHEIDVYPADPATGPGIRRSLEGGALIVHLDTHDGERALLDDGAVPFERLGLGGDTWLTILGGRPSEAAVGASLRGCGSPLVVTHQFSVAPHQSSAGHRALYKALGSGDSVSSALGRARFALEQLCDGDDFAWASPVLWAAPGGSQEEPALMAFPPPHRVATQMNSPEVFDAAAATYLNVDKTAVAGVPMSAPVFVHETLRVLTQGAGTQDERGRRAAALRELGGSATVDVSPDPSLSPAERIRDLTDRFVGALGRDDEALGRPSGFESDVSKLADRLAISPASVETAAMAVRAARAVFLRSNSLPEAIGLAQGVASELYGYVGNILPLNEMETLLEGPSVSSAGDTRPGGWLFRSIAANWRRDEVDPFQPEQIDPATRMPLVARRGDGWQIFNGAWLIVPDADRLPASQLRALQQALSTRVLAGIGPDGRTYRLLMPQDFRVLLIGAWMPGELDESIPVVEVDSRASVDSRVERWMGVAAERVGLPTDQAAATARRRAAETIARYADWLNTVVPKSNHLYETALCFAVIRGGYPEEAAREGLETALNGRLETMPPSTIAVVRAALGGSPAALKSALVNESMESSELVSRLEGVLGQAFDGPDPAAWIESFPESAFGV